MATEYQHVIVGGGLSGGLIALALADRGLGGGVALVEQADRLGGNHTWSFHETDLSAAERRLVDPLVSARWPRHTVAFPAFERTFEAGYASVSSQRFAELATARLSGAGVDLHLGKAVSTVSGRSVQLADGTTLSGRLVLDARGPATPPAGRDVAYQKFVGLELELEVDGPWTAPVLMDANVPQWDGYRFMYVLPFARRRVLIEDTVYSNSPALDARVGAERVLAYAGQRGAVVGRILRREAGVLPLPLREAPPAASTTSPVPVGYRGSYLHPVTGYSLPLAARVALAVADAETPLHACAAIQGLQRALAPQRRFGHLLNRLLFDAMPPAARWTALARFYRLPEATIARFYGSRSTILDRARILVGRPPAGLQWKALLGGTPGWTAPRMEVR